VKLDCLRKRKREGFEFERRFWEILNILAWHEWNKDIGFCLVEEIWFYV
jgi:hypothetical protein